MEGEPVKVYIYDISRGLARSMSQAFLGKRIDGIWHTGIVVFGKEYFFGGGGPSGTSGIAFCTPGTTIMGQPDTIHDLGRTHIPYDVFLEYLRELSQTTYRSDNYHLLDHNCNTFSNELANFLTGNNIPEQITSLPADVLSTPFGAMIRPFIDSMSVNPSGGQALFPQPNPPTGVPSTVHQPSTPTQASSASATQTRQEASATSSEKEKLTPILHKNTQVLKTFSEWKKAFTDKLNSSELELLNEIHEFLSTEKPTWSIGKPHLDLINRFLLNPNTSATCKGILLQCLQLAVLQEDIINALAHDSTHKLMRFVSKVEDCEDNVQVELTKVLSNCCYCQTGFDWLSSTKEWSAQDCNTNNCKAVTSVCVKCLLDAKEECKNVGVGLAYNLSLYKISEDFAVEISIALIQFLCCDENITEDMAFHSMSAVDRFSSASQEVIDLCTTLGVDWSKYKSKSTRLRKVCEELEKKCK